MNMHPGGAQALMHDTVWCGKPQAMVDDAGVAKGMKIVLEERGINTDIMVAEDMRLVLGNHYDFKAIVEFGPFGV